ncbi:hypothetical protein RR48_13953 [Papilio machaon]|uniref:Uncharacterized protein n=1 Tax=Papilio machaon TaxID=76193 RepID=A0A194RHQ6_PAPMA|nr:hypothetical protein RR48_13953 [Papilio machaon]
MCDNSTVHKRKSDDRECVESSPVEGSTRSSNPRPASSSSSGASDEPRSKRRRRYAGSVSREEINDMDKRFETLSEQLVSHLNNLFYANYQVLQKNASATPNVANVSTGAQNSVEDPFSCKPAMEDDIIELNVSIKEQSMPKPNPERLSVLTTLQRFNSSDWNSVRYSETQKKYVAFPGFSNLKVNEELRFLEDSSNRSQLKLYQIERSFAALSNAFLEQNELLNNALKYLLEWSRRPNAKLSPSSINEKLRFLFGNESDFKAVSHDILQIICGKRSEILESRRRALLTSLKGKYISEDIQKIPPSAEYMFNPQDLATYLQKVGGVDKLVQNIGCKSKPAVRKSPVRQRSPITVNSRDNLFRSNRFKTKQVGNRGKNSFDQRAKNKKGGQKNFAYKQK